ncbi:D-glycero-beta-D-manno-heptose-7-phosphate kinase [Aquitalea sp. LB_tupeE]|uniref:D-glycero-beta-D-manno-heptose-7-phosphate kinase n=1 Tax=Aquitalea sp. LB_tupeE TaxID=2748078 RepID=UPI0015B85ED9|nr:D-glycero-beta-D-manno-heptose-7-phosphate kinase [Aquitalea sp. LB_tupeE]NWK78265.1 D-glycero-beta-D-manno-heptose-7-phosphate kinase [Aquitalea sp. LB_tupeE]
MQLNNSSILVTGDVMIDRYWSGDSHRISPEAPVPVVLIQTAHDVPGGAANVAMNVANLGVATTLLSARGEDRDGQALQEQLQANQISCAFLADASLKTTVKLRVVARHQQVVRLDFEEKPDHEVLLPLVDMFASRIANQHAVIFSDYGKGGLIHIQQMIQLARSAGKPVLIDPKGTDYSPYRGATIITPNREEFAAVAGRPRDMADFVQRAFKLRDDLQLQALLVTRSEEGMSLFLGSQHIHIPTQAREVFDVSGAGDTVIATLAAGIASGMGFEEAAHLANRAAGIVVGKMGTSPITIEELMNHV